MAEGTTPSGWHDIDRRHRAGILLGAAFMLVAIGAGVAALTGEEPGTPADETSRTVTPAEQTSETTLPVPSYEHTTVADADDAGGGGAADGSGDGSVVSGGAGGKAPGATPAVASRRILYRRDGWLCVAALDGTAERRVAASASGVSSLSPDGATIASVDADGQLRLYDVAGGGSVEVGPAERGRPAWAPDSAWLVYTSPGQRVARVGCDGAGRRTLFSGRLPVVGPDAATVYASASTVQDPAVLAWRDGDLERLPVAASISGLACSASHIYIGSTPDSAGVSTLSAMLLSGAEERVQARSQNTARGVSIGTLLISSDGAWIVYAEQGDDGYSRVYAVPARGGAPVQISGRRDSYPLQWLGADNTLLLAEGNPTQGEPLSIVSATVPGGVRRLIVEGAGE